MPHLLGSHFSSKVMQLRLLVVRCQLHKTIYRSKILECIIMLRYLYTMNNFNVIDA